MIRAGRMAEFEIVQTEADVAAGQELNVEESANQVDGHRLALLQLLALDLSTQIRASDALAATPIEVMTASSDQTALQQQPEYLQRLIGSRQADSTWCWRRTSACGCLAGKRCQPDPRLLQRGRKRSNSRSWDSYAPGYRWKFPSATSRQENEVRAQVDVDTRRS